MTPPPEALLAVDVGSSSIRVSAIAPGGGVLRGVAAPTPIERPGPGREEIDVEEVWRVVRRLTGELGVDSLRIRGVGVAALLATVFFDQHDAPLRAGISWSDTRAREFAAPPASQEAESIRDLARRRPTGELSGARFAWLEAEEPARAARVARIGSLKDAIVARLTGRLVTDATHASYTGLYDVASRRWSEDLLRASGLSLDRLPPVLAATEAAGRVTAKAAAELRLPVETPVAVGAPDGTAGVLGTGALRSGEAVDIAGTTDVLMLLVDEPLVDPGSATVLNDYPAPGMWTIGGPTGMTGGAVEWIARLAGFDGLSAALEELGEEIERIGPGAGGIAVRTEMTGGRFPKWDDSLPGAVLGLRPHHGAAHLLRAAREGAAFTVAEGLEKVREMGGTVDSLTVAGGLARDPRALQMRADICAIPVAGCVDPQVTTLGSAMLAGVAAGVFASVEEGADHLAPASLVFEPRPAATEEYLEVRVRRPW